MKVRNLKWWLKIVCDKWKLTWVLSGKTTNIYVSLRIGDKLKQK